MPDPTRLRPALGSLWALVMPIAGSSALQSLAATLNGLYVGHMLDASSYAVMSVALPVIFLCSSLGITVSAGSSIVAAKAWGARDLARLRLLAQAALLLACALGLVIAGVGLATVASIIDTFRVPEGERAVAAWYLGIMFLALPVQLLNMTAAALLRSTGAAAAPLQAALVSLGTTVIVSPLAIACLGERGAGLVGAALAFFLAQLAALLWTAGFVHWTDHALRAVRRSPWRIGASLWLKILRPGWPLGLFFSVGAMTDLAMLSLVTAHGTVATASWGAVRQVMTYLQLPATSVAMAASTLAAQAIGARQPEHVTSIVEAALVLNLLLSGGLAVLAAFGGPLLVQGFVSDAQVAATAGAILGITAWGSVAFGMASVLTSVMRASGYTFVPTCLSLACLVFILNPAARVLEARLGLMGIWMAYPTTYCCALLLQGLAFRRRARSFSSPARTGPRGR